MSKDNICGKFVCCLVCIDVLVLCAGSMMFYGNMHLCRDKNMTYILQFHSLFKSYKPECVPERIPAVNLQLAFKAVGKMNQLFQEAKSRLDAGSGEEALAEIITWSIDHGMKKVSVGASLLTFPLPAPCLPINTLCPMILHSWLQISKCLKFSV